MLLDYRWTWRHTLSTGGRVWETIDAVPPVGRPESRSALLGIWWGVVPLTTLVGALVLAWLARESNVELIDSPSTDPSLAETSTVVSPGRDRGRPLLPGSTTRRRPARSVIPRRGSPGNPAPPPHAP